MASELCPLGFIPCAREQVIFVEGTRGDRLCFADESGSAAYLIYSWELAKIMLIYFFK